MRGLQHGPVGEHIHLYVEWLQRRGYIREIGQRDLSLSRDFGFWLAATGAGLADIQEALVTRYLAKRARYQPRRQGDASALARVLSVMRDATVIAPRPVPEGVPHEDLLDAYAFYMSRQRGLATISIASHLWFLRPFLKELRMMSRADAARLSYREVARYVERHAGDHRPTTARIMCSRLRAFLRYLHAERFLAKDLTAALPSVRRCAEAGLPRFMPIEDVQCVLAGCDRSTLTGRRDYAILSCLPVWDCGRPKWSG
ncbi:tyrosine-type recombinase/integrase [Novosphingobium rosa]|uniref:tyrosine-type recombinase/integrase n=1 Tax=Novosphingobium rosa TaxID=76978 RepID=UPI0012ED9BC1|nr:site-specific integrase [Novosphingobium rosa]